MVQRSMNLLAALLALGAADAMTTMVPQATAIGMVGMVGMSPRPTKPPGVPDGIPPELVKRQQTTIPYPPPGYYCGLVNGDVSNLLTCLNARANCIYSNTAVGCCLSSDIRDCTDIATACVNSMDPCDDKCKSDVNILKCTYTSVEPYCGTYEFPSGTRLYGCRSYADVNSQVLPLANYYSSKLGPNYTTIPVSTTSDLFPVDTPTPGADKTAGGGGGAGAQSSETKTSDKTPTSSSDADKNNGKNGKKNNSGGGLSGGAIAGIVIGVVAIIAAFGAFLVWVFFVKKRKDNGANNQPPPTAPLMGEHSQQGAAGGYYAPDHKPTGSEPPVYTPQQQQQQYPQEMPTHLAPQGSAGEYYNANRASSVPSEMAATPATATAPPASPGQMSATLQGPIQDNVYEMPGSRPGSR